MFNANAVADIENIDKAEMVVKNGKLFNGRGMKGN
jgi:hypothetical protein